MTSVRLKFDIFHGDTLLNEWDMMREANPAKKPSFDALAVSFGSFHHSDGRIII